MNDLTACGRIRRIFGLWVQYPSGIENYRVIIKFLVVTSHWSDKAPDEIAEHLVADWQRGFPTVAVLPKLGDHRIWHCAPPIHSM